MTSNPHCRIGRVRPKPIEIDPAGNRARQVRLVLGRAVRRAIESHGDALASFALVAWNMRGEPCTALGPDLGPIGEGMIPAYCHDVLGRQVTVALAERITTQPIPSA